MIYLASPYSTPIASVLEQRVIAATQFAALCVKDGFPVFSPIMYFHPMAKAFDLPTDAAYWESINMQFLRKADAVFALRLIGWEQSKGMTQELKVAKVLRMPVVHYGPDFKVIQ